MQNKHEELYYLMDLVRPNLLGDLDTFRAEMSRPIMYARAKDAKDQVRREADKQEHILRRAILPAYLERKKEVVLKDTLTVKREKVVFCELSEIQKKIYRRILTLPDFQLLRFANAPCECGVNSSYFRGYKKCRSHMEQLNYQRRHKDDLVPKKKCCFKYPWNPNRSEPGEERIDPDAILWIQMHEKPIGNPDDIEEEVIDGKYIACQVRIIVYLLDFSLTNISNLTLFPHPFLCRTVQCAPHWLQCISCTKFLPIHVCFKLITLRVD